MTAIAHVTGDSQYVLRGLWLFVTVFLTRGVFLFLLVYGISKAFPWLPAAFRHSLWFVVICAFVLLPMARLLLPPVQLMTGVSGRPDAVYGLLTAPLAYRESLESVIVSSGPVGDLRGGSARSSLLVIPAAAAYLCVMIFFLIRPFAARIMLRNLAASSREPSRLRPLMQTLADQIGIRRKVTLVIHGDVAVPFTYGFFSPRLILPATSRSWPRERLLAVLTHELAHVKRGDSLLNSLAQVACAILWCVPPVWIARFLMLKEAEISCDQIVLDRGFRKSEYAAALLALGTVQGKGYVQGAHGFLGRKSLVKERIQRILSTPRLPPPVRARVRRILVAVFCILLPLSALTCSLKETDKLFGTWVNYGKSGPARYAWTDKGVGQEFARYYASNDTGVGGQFSRSLKDLPCSLGRFTIEKEWKDSLGNTWYEVKTKWSSQDAPRYALIRLDPSGTSYESDESLQKYPTAFAGAIGTDMHQIYVRQSENVCTQGSPNLLAGGHI